MIVVLTVLAGLVGLATPAAAQDGAASGPLRTGAPVDPGDVASKVAGDVDRTAGPDEISALRRVGARLEVLEATVRDGAEAEAFVDAAARGGEVLAAEIDVPFHPTADPYRPDQWNLGPPFGFEPANADADGSGITVAVLDASIAAGHEDLRDRSGRTPLVAGYDFVESRPWDPADPTRQTGDGNHGTHVAGIIAAVPNDGEGIHGAAPGAAIMPVRVITADGGRSADVAAGILWAVDNGADVLNLSLSASSESQLVREAVRYAATRGAVLIASAGNDGPRGAPAYPAAHEPVIGVGAVGADGVLWTQSTHGAHVDVVAPGVGIVSLGGVSGDYRRMTGTSQAAPHVSALAALILSADPGLTPAEVEAIIEDTATDRGPAGFDNGYGNGLIDAVEAVAVATPGTPAPPTDLQVIDRGGGVLRLRWDHADTNRLGYEVLRDGAVIATLRRNVRTYDIARPDPATAPFLQVRAIGRRGSRSPAVSLLAAPLGVATAGAVNRVTVSWPPVPGAGGYAVYRDRALIGTVGTAPGADGRVTFTDAVRPGRNHRYQVAARTAQGLRGTLSAPVPGAARQPAPVVSGTVRATVAAGAVRLSWPAAAGAVTGYTVVRDGTSVAGVGSALSWTDPSPPAGRVSYQVVAIGPGGRSPYPAVTVQTAAPATGYWIVTDRGRVLPFGDAAPLGGGTAGGDVVAGAATVTGNGYWLAHADGTVEAFGDAVWHGDVRNLPLVAPIVAMATLPTGGGYWLLAADGGVFTFGAANFHGSTGGIPLVAPVIDMAATPTGNGYWFVAADGGVFTFGDGVFRGSTGGWTLDAPVVSMAAGPGGYWLIARDGGVFSFGTMFYGSLPGTLSGVPPGQRPDVVRMRPVNGGRGYLLLAADGGTFGYGHHATYGSAYGLLQPGERVVDLMIS